MRFGRSATLLDPGWPFVLAGLVLIASAVLVPATYDLWVMRAQLAHLDAQERENGARLDAYTRFVQALDSADPQLVRRLAASQLNLVPRGERPMIVAGSARRSPVEWAELTVAPVRAAPEPFPDSLLSRLTLGRKGLWILGAGAMCVFLGLLSAPVRVRVPRPEEMVEAGAAAARSVGLLGRAPAAPAALAMAAGPVIEALPSARARVSLGTDLPLDSDPLPSGSD
jgi:hypothetical protein